MSTTTLPNATILAAYEAMTPGSARLAEKARAVLPSGLAHDSRNFDPYPIYVAHAAGPLKWDVDGNRYVDYFGGHGALLLGHNHPKVLAAIHAALDRGTHFGACHELEVRWAELVCQMVPSAECVRFTSSGTEATLMALRLARAYTGRTKLLRFRGHFHGWHDHMTSGHHDHFDGSASTGVLGGVADNVLLCDPNDTAGLIKLFEQHRDIAAAILEPTGAHFGRMPILPEFLQTLRTLTKDAGTILVFDEVVTGFRCSPGGAQQALGITPDMTTLAKILPVACRVARCAGGATSWTCWTSSAPKQRGSRRSRTPARSTPTPSRPPPASPRWRSFPAPMPAPRPTRSAKRCVTG